ncbi:hypothetical protein V5N11_027747 [Cardamine amara subsp. amara]|uniref:TIP41-like protein n=1 Tax=Cardamine amara subsp. amara TaxID=228776 RepID=A0ABD0ZML0_CARAN
MEPTSLIGDAEFWLPPEFLTDEDFLVEKENNGGGIDETRHGFGGFGSTVKPNTVKEGDEENFLAVLTKTMVQSTLEDDFSGGFCGNHTLPAVNDNKAWCMARSPLCAAGNGCCCRNQRSDQNSQSRRVSSQAAWDLYSAAAEEMAKMNINDEPYGYNSGRGLLGTPRKLSSSVKNRNNGGSGYFNHQSLQYQKLQAMQFLQLKQQQFMKHHRQLVQQSRELRANSNKNVGSVNLSSSAWSNQLPRREVMRAVFLGDHTGKRGSTGTGVFLPRCVNHASSDKKPTISTVLVPARVAQVLNLNLNEPVRSSVSLDDVSWRQRSNNGGFSSQMHGGVRAEQAVNEPRLPSEWAY